MKQLIKQTSLLTISNVLTKVASMIFFIILARFFSVEEYGSFRYLLTIATIFSIAFTGVTTALTRFISRNKNKKNEYFINTLVLILPIYLISLIIIFLFTKNPVIISLFLLSLLIDAIYLGLIRGLLNSIKLALFKLNENLIQLAMIMVLYFLVKQVNFNLAVIFFSISGIISLIILEIYKPSKLKLSKISKEKIKELVKFALPVTLGSVGFDIMFGIDTIFIKYFLDTSQVGIYSVGRTLIQVFSFIPLALTTIIMPRVAKEDGSKKIKKGLKIISIITFLISIVIFLLLVIFGKYIIILLFTEKYIEALTVLYILSIGQIFLVIHLIYSAYWQGIGKPNYSSAIILICCILNIVGNFVLVPRFGIVGAAISTTITSVIAFLITMGVYYYEQKFKKVIY